MKKATAATKVEKVVLSFGINNRNQKLKETAMKQLSYRKLSRQQKIDSPTQKFGFLRSTSAKTSPWIND